MSEQKNPKSKIVKVRADELSIHPLAQREIVPSNFKRIKEYLDLDAIGIVHAVEYDKRGLLVIDGQHRIQALLAHGFGEWLVQAEVHLDIRDDKAACDKFLKLNKRAAVNPYATFMAEFHSGYPEAVGVMATAKRHGLKIAKSAGDGNLVCVATLKKLWGTNHGEALDTTLSMILAAWGSKAAAVEGRVIEGLGLVLCKYNGTLDTTALTKKLAKYSGGPSGLIGNARGLVGFRKTTVSRCVAECIVEAYNNGRRGEKLDSF